MKRVVVALLLAVSGATAGAARADEARELTLDDFDVHQYVSSSGLSPVSIMRLDTNDEVLIACRRPRTRDELKAMGIDALESQLVLLRAMRMLRLNGGRFETVLPLLDADDTSRLRRAPSALAPELAVEIGADVEALSGALAKQGFPGHTHSVLFSYVLDGMAWEFFEEYGEVQPRRLTAASPHWAGEIWGTYPPRELAAGTSAIVSSGLALRISRPTVAGSPVDGLLASWPDLRELLRRHAGQETVLDGERLKRLAAFGIVDGAGEIAVPILVEKPGEEVFEIAQRVTEKVVAAAREKLALEELAADLGLRDRRQALVMAYHELMWGLMAVFTADGSAPRPALLAGPLTAERADVAEVVFVVDRRRPEAHRSQDEEGEPSDG